jgi:hypothetical protein
MIWMLGNQSEWLCTRFIFQPFALRLFKKVDCLSIFVALGLPNIYFQSYYRVIPKLNKQRSKRGMGYA